MIGTTVQTSYDNAVTRRNQKIFKLRLIREYTEDQEIINALRELLTEPKTKNERGSLKPGLYKEEYEKGIVLILIK